MHSESIELSDVRVSSGGVVKRSHAWQLADTSLYTLQSITLEFTMDTSSGYSVKIYDETGSQRGNGNAAAAQNSTVTLTVSPTAWQGKSSGTLSAWFYQRGSSQAHYINIKFWLNYEEIANTSTATVQRAVAGEPQTVLLSNTSPSAWHTVRWIYANGAIDSGEMSFNAATRSPSWSVPENQLATLLTATPSSGTATGSVIVTTYTSSGSSVGTMNYDALLDIPDRAEWRPTLTVGTHTVVPDTTAQAVSAVTGNNLVKNHTQETFAVSASAVYGATITAIRIRTDDGTFTAADVVVSTTTWTDDTLDGVITVTVLTENTLHGVCEAVDSRGFVTSVPVEYQDLYQDYREPAVTGIQAMRCDQNGNETEEGAYIWVEATAQVAAISQSVTYTAVIREKGSSTAIQTVQLQNGVGVIGGTMSSEKTYVVTVTVQDQFGIQTSAAIEIGTGIVTISRIAGGKGVAFGKLAERYGVEITEEWPFWVHGQEILRLMVDVAHPVGSVIESIKGGWNPNEEWPWTRWGQASGKWIRGV